MIKPSHLCFLSRQSSFFRPTCLLLTSVRAVYLIVYQIARMSTPEGPPLTIVGVTATKRVRIVSVQSSMPGFFSATAEPLPTLRPLSGEYFTPACADPCLC